MADEREVTIVIRGKNLTSAEFAAARKDLAGFDDGVKKSTSSTALLTGAMRLAGGAFAGMSIASYAKDALSAAGNIVDLAAQTGLSTRAIQQMSHVADQTGTSLEAFTNAAFKLGTNLSGEGKSVVAAVEKLGLSFQELKSMQPEEQFELIVAALHKMENPQERNLLAVELFGKAAKEILPSIAEGYASIADSATIAGDKQLQAIDKTTGAWDRLLKNVQTTFIQLVGSGMLAYEQLGTGVDTLTEKERAHLAFLKKSGLDAQSYLDEIIERNLKLRVEQEQVRLATERQVKGFGELKALDIPKDIGVFELQYKKLERELTKTVAAQNAATAAHQRFTDAVKNDFYTADFYTQFKAAVHETSFELEALASTVPAIAQAFVPFQAAVREAEKGIETFGDRVRTTMVELPNVILSAIQGGGSALGSAGAFIGTSLMSKFQDKFGPAITAALPFGIGAAINALLPTLGTLFGPIAERIGGFFRSIFGGPSAEELRGRQAVADFEAQLHSLLNQTQRNEAGNESWKMTVIAIRDAFIAQGLSEEQAMAAAERLWKSSKKGAAEVQAAIAAINAVMNRTTATTTEAGEATTDAIESINQAVRETVSGVQAVTAALNNIPRTIDVDINAEYHGPGSLPDFAGSFGGYARGTFGVHGEDFHDFGAGTPVMLHHRESVTPYQDRVPTAMRWLDAEGLRPAAAPGPITLNVLVQRGGDVRLLSDEAFILEKVQDAFDGGLLTVSQRLVSHRTGR